MDNDSEELQNLESEAVKKQLKKDHVLAASVLVSALVIAGAWVYTTGLKVSQTNQTATAFQVVEESRGSAIEDAVLPPEGVVLPVRWNDLGAKMVDAGVIDAEKLESVYAGRGGLTDGMRGLLYGGDNGNLKITAENSGEMLNLLWAFGLANKNAIIEKGPMMDPSYGGASRFASTAGWTLSSGNPMDHYSRHPFIILTPKQQQIIEQISKNIYRPCCGNSTYFPDCNHGMAMLGLLELMASQGVSEEEMYRTALQVNSYWFPDTYLAIARLLSSRGAAWDSVDPRGILGAEFSSISGYKRVLRELEAEPSSGSGCGVDGSLEGSRQGGAYGPGIQERKSRGGGCGV